MTREKIIKNSAQCLICQDILVSKHVHDFQRCKCGNLSVDGGNEYLKRSVSYLEILSYKDLSETITVEE